LCYGQALDGEYTEAHYPMPYPAEKKREALAALAENDGDLAATHEQTGVSKRTLRRWRKAAAASKSAEPPFDVSLEKHLQKALLQIVDSIAQQSQDAALNHQVSAFNGLFDRLLKLRDEQPATAPECIEVVYVDEDGSRHQRPSWHREALTDDHAG